MGKILRLDPFFEDCLNSVHARYVRRQLKAAGKRLGIQKDFKCHNPQYISIGDDFKADERIKIDAWDAYGTQRFRPCIRIGSNVSMNSDCYISAIDRITVGDGVMMGRNVFITDHAHGKTELYDCAPAQRELYSKGEVRIGDHVFIGSNVCILSGVTIGDNCIIGANAVVTNSLPDNVVAGGIPARVIKHLN